MSLDAALVGSELGKATRAALEKRDARIAALENRVSALEGDRLSYVGVWETGEYVRGNVVTHGGSLWHCNAPTRETPGNGSRDWTLCVKRGRDAR
jgi:hypothetical protein